MGEARKPQMCGCLHLEHFMFVHFWGGLRADWRLEWGGKESRLVILWKWNFNFSNSLRFLNAFGIFFDDSFAGILKCSNCIQDFLFSLRCGIFMAVIIENEIDSTCIIEMVIGWNSELWWSTLRRHKCFMMIWLCDAMQRAQSPHRRGLKLQSALNFVNFLPPTFGWIQQHESN